VTDEIASLLAAAIDPINLPGVAVGALSGDGRRIWTAGVAGPGGEAVREDTAFQIGSITKVYTTTLVMRAVERGLLELDEPVHDVFPDIAFANPDAQARITLRHLLSHTSGLDGDLFSDHADGPDAIERYVTTCAMLPSLSPPGERYSYCNAGFVIAGALAARAFAVPYEQALGDLVDDLGVKTPTTERREGMSAAWGRHVESTGEVVDVDPWTGSRAMAPSGSTPLATIHDLLTFAEMHLDDGRVGTRRVLSVGFARAMREEQVSVPDGGACGLGWHLARWGDHTVVRHDGWTLGQRAFLSTIPATRTAATVLANGYRCDDLVDAVFRRLLGDAGRSKPPLLAWTARPRIVRPARYVGTYHRLGMRSIVADAGEGRMTLTRIAEGGLASYGVSDAPIDMAPIADDRFAIRDPVTAHLDEIAFLGGDAEGATYLFDGGRLAVRVGGADRER
jgi:CubicO group peptidase (beta-lactamase class C family)